MRRILLTLTAVALVSIPAGQAGDSTQSQLKHSTDVLRFFDNHSWLQAPRKERCSEVPWQRSCTIARKLIQQHTANRNRIIKANDPIIGRLNRGLAGTPMAGLGVTLRDIGKQYNISPYFMAAVAGTESSFGHAACSNNPKNVWGLAACDGRWYVPYFNSWDEAIRFYASFLADRWPSATSPHDFHGYAACTPCWGRKTSYWMGSRFGVSSYTKYPN